MTNMQRQAPVGVAGDGTPALEAPDAAGPAATDTRIGRVVAVSGSQAVVLVDDAHGDGARRSPQVGALVKVRTPRTTVYGLVSGLSIPMPSEHEGDGELKIVEMELMGEAPNQGDAAKRGFRRGVSAFPALGDRVYAADPEDLRSVYAPPSASCASIGAIHQDPTVPAFVVVDDMLGKHFAILGTTGTGKSCATALILRAVLAKHPNGHIVLLDPHNEYEHCFGDAAEVIHPSTLDLPYWMLNFEEIVETLIGSQSPHLEVDSRVLGDVILAAKRRYLADNGREETITVDTPVPYRISDATRLLDEAMGRLDKVSDSTPHLRLKSRLEAIQNDRRFSFMFPGLTMRDNMSAVMARLLRIPVEGKPITILDLSGVPSEVINVVVSLLCRLVFDFALWSDRAVPVLLVCEEAHRYAPLRADIGFEPTKRALSRIAKEGRKYGVSLCLVTQRPSELATGILSQCNTVFAMRMSNQKDQEFVRSALSEWVAGLLDALPSLRNAEVIALGEGVPVPARIVLDELPEKFRPRSGTASFSAGWAKQPDSPTFVDEVVARWRRQRR